MWLFADILAQDGGDFEWKQFIWIIIIMVLSGLGSILQKKEKDKNEPRRPSGSRTQEQRRSGTTLPGQPSSSPRTTSEPTRRPVPTVSEQRKKTISTQTQPQHTAETVTSPKPSSRLPQKKTVPSRPSLEEKRPDQADTPRTMSPSHPVHLKRAEEEAKRKKLALLKKQQQMRQRQNRPLKPGGDKKIEPITEKPPVKITGKRSLRDYLVKRNDLARAFVLSEVLDKPLGLRDISGSKLPGKSY